MSREITSKLSVSPNALAWGGARRLSYLVVSLRRAQHAYGMRGLPQGIAAFDLLGGTRGWEHDLRVCNPGEDIVE